MKLTLDVENTTTKRDGKLHLDPFEPTNKLIMVGCLEDNGQQHLFNMDVPDGIYLQEVLDRATILIGHNICLLYTSPSPRDRTRSRMPSSA